MKKHNPESVRVALIGYGYWGPNLLRNLVSNGGFRVVGVAELNNELRQKCGKSYPHIAMFADVAEMLATAKPEAVLIATPPHTHHDLALQCLMADADVLIEKPMALSVEACDAILKEASRRGKKVMIDHTFVYHPAVQYLASQIHQGNLGDLLYYDSVRINLGGFQTSTNVLWDLAPHDLSILDLFLKGKTPNIVSVTGVHHFDDKSENLCYATLNYENNFVAHLNLNWVAPVKVRTVMVGGSRKLAVYDDNLSTEKVKIYDKGLVLGPREGVFDPRVSYRVGDMVAPAISSQEALGSMLTAFHKYLTLGVKPPTDGEAGRRVVQILEAASLSLGQKGETVSLRVSEEAPKQKVRKAA